MIFDKLGPTSREKIVFRWLTDAVRTHPFNFFTLVIALAAASFTGWGAFEAHKQAEEARLARIEAAAASEAQKIDVERSRIAAEKSREAAEKLADATQKSSESAERTAKAAERSTTLSAENLRATLASLIAQQRPALEIVAAEPNKEGTIIKLALRNSGHSTARDIRTEENVEIGSADPDYKKKADAPPTGGEGFQPDIPSGSQVWTEFFVPSSERMTKCCDYQKGDVIRVYGVVYYSDFDKHQFKLQVCYDVDRTFSEAFGAEGLPVELTQCYAIGPRR